MNTSPDSDASLPTQALARIDSICDEFESAILRGENPQIEAYLTRASGDARNDVLRWLIMVEIDYLRKSGTPPRINDYHLRFPDHVDAVQAAFEPGASRKQEVADPSMTCPGWTVERDAEPMEPPAKIGRYSIERMLGKGSFGIVYLGFDDQLQRRVAIKVPHAKFVNSAETAELYLSEARTVAGLDHPNIIQIHDVGQTDAFPCYIVTKHVDGVTLRDRLADLHRCWPTIADLLATIAEALHYAHMRGLVHRDIKPANILLDQSGQPHLVDFGLALREADLGKGTHFAGTLAYMSPEQARHEAHRVDGRSDIYSLGVVLYELLTGRRTFQADTPQELTEQIAGPNEAKPPRQIDDLIPKELERICLKALAKRASDRYTTARDMADDLREFRKEQSGPAAPPAPGSASVPVTLADSTHAGLSLDTAKASKDSPQVRVVPKGLRSFDEHDADFFLELLPGPRDRDGLPESVRFWKTRIEQTDPDKTFSVGLIYGPSGCGKSSLMRAGVLPRLSRQVIVIYLEATPEDMESRIQMRLYKQLPHLSHRNGLRRLLTALRCGEGLSDGSKVLLVLDQFEQWLHAHRDRDETGLSQALRQCDGGNLQCLLMVRDDFWMGATRFMRELEVPLVEGHNSQAVDRFPVAHARQVLTAFGRALHAWPDATTGLTHAQKQFLSTAIGGFAQEGKVVCVRLALFAEMMKGRPWTLTGLREVGGTEGVGVTFLEETLGTATSPPRHRLHQEAARAVLRALLPEPGSDMKGHQRSSEELQEVSGYANRRQDYVELIQLLDGELRLITPIDPEGLDGVDPPRQAPDRRYYQLTHDFLVPSLREWLTRKQRESRRGRAELRLAEATDIWSARPQNQRLPTALEYLQIVASTRRRERTGPQRRMMAAATRFYFRWLATASVILAVLGWSGREFYGRVRSSALIDQLLASDVGECADTVEKMQGYHAWTGKRLHAVVAAPTATPDQQRRQLHARLALVPQDESQVDELIQSLLTAGPDYFGIIRGALEPYRQKVEPVLWNVLRSTSETNHRRFRAGMALAEYAPDDERWQESDLFFLADALVTSNPEHQAMYRKYLRGLAAGLVSPLVNVFKGSESADQQAAAANGLAELAAGDPVLLADLLCLATPKQYAILFPLIAGTTDQKAAGHLATIAAAPPPKDMPAEDRIPFGKRRAGAGITLLRLGEKEAALRTLDSKDDLEAMTQCIHRCRERGVTADQWLDLLDQADQPGESVSARHAILLALGEYPLHEVPARRRDALLEQVKDWYAHDPSSAVHGVSGWLLRHWEQHDAVEQVDQTPLPNAPDREWFTLMVPVEQDHSPSAAAAVESHRNALCMTFIVFAPGEYRLGCPDDEFGRFPGDLDPHLVTITRPFAVLDRELTWEAFNAAGTRHHAEWERQFELQLGPQLPAFGFNWSEAVEYCRWLTVQAGLSESDQCYMAGESPADGPDGSPRTWSFDPSRTGFRLPTSAEWEIACRAGTQTAYSFGGDTMLLNRYACFGQPDGWSQPVASLRPNPRGLFDIHGNVYEWCHDWFGDGISDGRTDPLGPRTGTYRVHRGGSWANGPANCRSAHRYDIEPSSRIHSLGLRIAITVSP